MRRRPKPETDGSGLHGPYWLRAHKDWRFLAVVGLMLTAMVIYMATMNLSLRPRRPGQAVLAVQPAAPDQAPALGAP
jgi:hypothetical protein